MITPAHMIWDWNGTLFDDAFANVQSLNAILLNHSFPSVTLEQYRERFGFPVKAYYEELGFDFSRDDWDRITQEFHEYYVENSGTTRLRDGVREALASLQGQGMPMSVLSVSETSVLENALCAEGIRGYFTEVRGTTDLYAHSKLNGARDLLSKLAMAPDRILMIGDTIHDHEIAGDLGCRCILVAGGHQAEHRLKQCGCPVVSCVDNLLATLFA